MDSKAMTAVAATAIIGAVISLAFVGQKEQAKNNADNTANLPATNANVKTNADALLRLEARTNGQINRREKEMIAYVNTLDDKKKQRIDDIRTSIQREMDLMRGVIEDIKRDTGSNTEKVHRILGWQTNVKSGS